MITRRTLLHRIGTIGGLGATFAAMQAMGLESSALAKGAPVLSPTAGAGVHIAVLGAGIAGLTAAYELEQAGFLVTLLEARERVGGRAWTLRSGDKVEMEGEDTQTVNFSDGLYMNAGPARIPSFHQGLLNYARKFGVPMEVEVNASRSAYVVGADGSKMRMRTAINDMRGHVSELLAKAIDQGALDRTLSASDKAKLRPFLRFYGDLDEQGRFTGTERSGLKNLPGAGTTFAAPETPVPLSQLLANEQMPMMLFEEAIYMQPTMFEPVGGMDMIHKAFDRHLRRSAVRGAAVTRIRQTGKGVAVDYVDRASGTKESLTADYLISTIPFPVLAKIPAALSPKVAKAVAGVIYDHSNKVGFDAPRFWEREEIYGGISFVGAPTQLIWYPSAGLHGERGMLLGCYNSGAPAAAFEKLSLADQIAAARAAVERAHPGHGADLANPVVVDWKKVPFSLGPWPNWLSNQESRHDDPIDTDDFRLLQNADGRIYFASAALSQTPGWQEGGIQSAWRAVALIAERVRATALSQSGRLARAG